MPAPPALALLREAGIDVVAVGEWMPAASDAAVIAFARDEPRWVLSFDRDYGDLVVHRGLLPPPESARMVLDLVARPDEVIGCLDVVSQQNIRTRRFPGVAAGQA